MSRPKKQGSFSFFRAAIYRRGLTVDTMIRREMTTSPHNVILAYAELNAQAIRDLPACLDVHLGKRYHGDRHIGNMLLCLTDKILDSFVRDPAELRLADLVIERGILGVQAHAHRVDESGKLGQNISLVDQVRVAIRINAHH